MSKETVLIEYTNHRGETRTRRIQPVSIRFAATPWHGDAPEWLLEALDLEKGEMRSFALKDVHSWSSEEA